MNVSHEVPRMLLDASRDFNDYDYALVHKFKEDEQYYDFFKQSLEINRTVYLDNSLFELETMFDHSEFAHYVNELGSINEDKFTYIIPDSLEEKDETINSFKEFRKSYPNLPGKTMGVVQGKNLKEIIECYEFMAENADVIAISFDYSYYIDLFPDEQNNYFSWMKGRQYLIDLLIKNKIWSKKPHHLLGCGLPQEFKHYSGIENIVSCDTSNPIVHAIKGIRYNDWGLDSKESIKLVDLFETKVIEESILHHNVRTFKGFCS